MRKFISFLLFTFLSITTVFATTGTITFSELGLENGVQYSEPFDGGDFTVTFAGGANDGKYYTTGAAIRVYGNGTMTISGKTNNLVSVTIIYDGSNKPTSNSVVNAGTYNNYTGVWTGNVSSVVFTRPSGSGHWRVKSISVETSSGESVPVSSVSLNQTSLELTEGDSETLTATVLPDNASIPTVTWHSNDEGVATVDAGVVTAVSAGTCVITAVSDGDPTKQATCSVTVNAAPVYQSQTFNYGYGQIVVLTTEDVNGDYYELTSFSTTSTIYGIGTAYTTEPAATLMLEVVEGNEDNTFALTDGDIYLTWKSGNSLKTSATLDDNSSWYIQIIDDNAFINNYVDETRQIWWNESSPRFACYAGKTLGTANYAITKLYGAEKEYQTYFFDYKVQIPDGVKVYIAHLNGNVVNLEEIYDYIPANTAVIVSGYIGSYTFTETQENVSAIVGNDLLGSTTDVTPEAGYNYYGLIKGSQGLGFYMFEPDEQHTTFPAYKAYLKVPQGQQAPERLEVSFGTDSISTRLSIFSDDVQTYKYFHNGILYIKQNNNTYNVLGIKVD